MLIGLKVHDMECFFMYMCVIKRRAKKIGDEKNLKGKILQTQTPKNPIIKTT